MSEDVFHVQKSFGCRKKKKLQLYLGGDGDRGGWVLGVRHLLKCLGGANSFEPVKRSFFLGVKKYCKNIKKIPQSHLAHKKTPKRSFQRARIFHFLFDFATLLGGSN